MKKKEMTYSRAPWCTRCWRRCSRSPSVFGRWHARPSRTGALVHTNTPCCYGATSTKKDYNVEATLATAEQRVVCMPLALPTHSPLHPPLPSTPPRDLSLPLGGVQCGLSRSFRVSRRSARLSSFRQDRYADEGRERDGRDRHAM